MNRTLAAVLVAALAASAAVAQALLPPPVAGKPLLPIPTAPVTTKLTLTAAQTQALAAANQKLLTVETNYNSGLNSSLAQQQALVAAVNEAMTNVNALLASIATPQPAAKPAAAPAAAPAGLQASVQQIQAALAQQFRTAMAAGSADSQKALLAAAHAKLDQQNAQAKADVKQAQALAQAHAALEQQFAALSARKASHDAAARTIAAQQRKFQSALSAAFQIKSAGAAKAKAAADAQKQYLDAAADLIKTAQGQINDSEAAQTAALQALVTQMAKLQVRMSQEAQGLGRP